jgi:glycosyltransferase involved in cell wall biosynthesis
VPASGEPTADAPRRPIRVLLAIKSLGHGGAERLLVDTVNHGDRQAFHYEVAFVLSSGDALVAELESGGTTVHDLGGRTNLDLSWMAALRRLLVAGEYDIVHFHLPYTAALGRLVVASLPRRHRPVTIYTEHSMWNKVAVLVKPLNRATIGRDRALIAVSPSAYDALPRSLRRRAQVVVHGVDRTVAAEVVARRSELRAAIRAELGVPDGQLLAVTVANLRSEKGYDVLLDAARLVQERGLPIRFAAAGHGALEAELVARHRSLGLGPRFAFLGHRGDALALLTAADVVVLPSHQEGLPVVLMEAFTVGATIVATSVGGVPLVIEDGVNGLRVPPGDPGRLADALQRVSADPDLAARLGRRARADSDQFDMARASRDIEGIYRRALSSPA